jgi:VWFA-related protein
VLIVEGAPNQALLVADGIGAPATADDLKIKPGKDSLSIKCVTKDEQRGVDLHVTIPAGVKVKVKAEEGTVQVHGAVTGVRVETLSGDVILGIPPDDLKVEVTWTEGYARYAGPPLERVQAPAALKSATQGAAPLPVVMTGKTGQGRIPVNVRTLNGWVEVGRSASSAGRVVVGAVPPHPLSQAARAIAGSKASLLGSAIRYVEPRLEMVLEQLKLSQPSASTEEEDAIKLESPLVNLNASVADAEGKAISGLTAADFVVSEGGAKQEISHFAAETSPFNLVLLLDVSGSTRGKLDLIKRAALRFTELMRPSDKIAVIFFARDVEVAAHLTDDREAIKQAIYQVVPPLGNTAVYDAIAYSLVEEIGRVRGQRNAVVVLTDGRDSSIGYADTPLANDPMRRAGSFLRFSDLVAGVMQSDALIYPIAVDNEAEIAAALNESGRAQVRAGTQLAAQQLQQLADFSGGRLYRATRLEDLDGVYEQIAADLRTIYSLAYYMPTPAEKDGQWRQVEVTVTRPGARVRSRRGYFTR